LEYPSLRCSSPPRLFAWSRRFGGRWPNRVAALPCCRALIDIIQKNWRTAIASDLIPLTRSCFAAKKSQLPIDAVRKRDRVPIRSVRVIRFYFMFELRIHFDFAIR
jgi:hypothetical protein